MFFRMHSRRFLSLQSDKFCLKVFLRHVLDVDFNINGPEEVLEVSKRNLQREASPVESQRRICDEQNKVYVIIDVCALHCINVVAIL